eukprot:CAMPEP_0183309702 /NCGR_PEP_ID=MMETSP0160_2-20130417/25496_1 /TAXON_ID=2839 ORGANISM="Odontella Sinensis, Strain Grunow 1884" /NCGR_SAMPLE_ID=MMETSP0160_2 /ASSEMBLY_ACC=CAM_ASM_000250 /LENGTH=345 /DNA_ID=CAMNT_0025473767 /DNA_START=60 /DNA_END=1097 /DNA_ORIENTATION=+
MPPSIRQNTSLTPSGHNIYSRGRDAVLSKDGKNKSVSPNGAEASSSPSSTPQPPPSRRASEAPSPSARHQMRSAAQSRNGAKAKVTASGGSNEKSCESGGNCVTSQTAATELATPSSVVDSFGATGNMANLGMMGGMHGGGYGMMMSPYGYGMGMGMGHGMMGGPFSGLNNFLFGFQSAVFSLGQAMQILGMNTQALHQLFNTAMSMFDNALTMLNEMRALDLNSISDGNFSEEEKKRRRRLKALRWSLMLGVSYAGYKLVHRWLSRRRQLQQRLMPFSTDDHGRYLENRYSYPIHQELTHSNGYSTDSYGGLQGGMYGGSYGNGSILPYGYSNFRGHHGQYMGY